VNELWQKGSGQVLIGNFHGAVDTLGQAETLEPGNTELKTAINWIRETINLDDSRERLRIRSYEHFVAEAKKAAEQARQGKAVAPEKEASEDQAPGEAKDAPAVQGPDEGKTPDEAKKDGEGKKEGYRWSKALDYTQRAMLNTKDEEAFRSEPWVKEIVDGALVEIDGYKKANEWRDALVVYDMLMSLYPKNQDYKAGFDFCRNRAHLDFAYGPKNDWRADLRDVGPEALGEILSRVEDDYVKTADCKKLCTSGLQSLLVLAQADSLTKTFPTLGDQDLVMSFVTRLNGLIKRKIEPAAKFGAKDVVSVFRNVLEANKDSLRLPENVVVDEFVAGLLEPLDEFTSVIWPSEVEEFNKHTRGEFVGVGIQITQPEGSCVRVETPLEDSPAYAAGVKPGDWITEVDGKSTRDMTINQAVREITGEPGTQVTLTIRNPLTDESRKLTLTRQRITIRTVSGFHRDEAKPTGWDYFIDPDSRIGYVSVTAFMDKTVDDLEQALKQLHLQGCRGLILDLRFNPGGLLTSAVRMCELFMAENDPIVQTKGRSRSQNTEIRSRFGQQGDGPPLIILVNEFSASASEIVAGALAGLKEACVVGTRTFGKGSVQNLIPIEDNQAYLKLTTAYYYIPDVDVPAKWYLLHRETDSESWGVEPHVIVKAIPQEIAKIARLRRERDLLKGKDQTRIPKEVLDRQATSQPSQHLQEDENPDTDPQLATALNIMRVKLLSKQPWALAPRHERILSHADAGRKAHLATP
jgi:carboxyl-terminal processing protease